MRNTTLNNQLVSCFNNLSEAICIIDENLFIEYTNSIFESKYNITCTTSNKIQISDLINVKVLAKVKELLRNSTKEQIFISKNGDEDHCLELNKITIENNSKIILIENCHDYELINSKLELAETQEKFKATIEQLKFSAKKIEVNEDEFRLVLNKMPILIMAIDKTKQVLFWNNECERVTGFCSSEITNVPNAFSQVFSESDFNELIKKSTKEVYRNYQTVINCKDGTTKNILWSGLSKENPILEWDSWVVGIDITEKHVQEERLLYESSINESLAKSSGELISPSLSIDNIARILFNACINLTGCESGFIAFDDPLNDNILMHYFNDSHIDEKSMAGNFCFIPRNEYFATGFYGYPIDYDKPRIENELNASTKRKIGSNSPTTVKNCIVQPAIANEILMGQIVIINSPLGFKKRHHEFIKSLANVYALAIFRKRMEWDLLGAKKHAEESDRLKTAFLANMSHEIRTPMNAIVGFSELLIKEGLNQRKKVEFTKLIRNSCDDLLMLVNDIIDISKIEAGQLKFHPTKFSTQELLLEIKQLGEQQVEVKGKFIPIIFDNIDETDHDIFVDKSRVKQVFNNLIGNAIKFTESGGVNFGYHFEQDNFITFYVKDTGIGIPYDEQKHIFENFRQIETTISRNYGGTGLGLSISQNLVEQMGGELKMSSKLGNGSIFWFTIPFSIQKVESKNKFIKPTKYSNDLLLNNKTILVVEDEPRNAKLLNILLTTTHAKVITAYNGLEAIDAVKREKPDLVLMDIQMPEMDGLEATKRIKSMHSDIPIIAQTAYAMKEDMEKCIKAGCKGYISKPIKKDELFMAIQETL